MLLGKDANQLLCLSVNTGNTTYSQSSLLTTLRIFYYLHIFILRQGFIHPFTSIHPLHQQNNQSLSSKTKLQAVHLPALVDSATSQPLHACVTTIWCHLRSLYRFITSVLLSIQHLLPQVKRVQLYITNHKNNRQALICHAVLRHC